MQWGWLPDPRGGTLTPPLPVVVFRGDSGNRSVLPGGSRGHVLGQHAGEGQSAQVSYSVLPSLLTVLRPHVSELAPEHYSSVTWGRLENIPDHAALLAVEEMEIEGPFQDLEFLAVPLADTQLYSGMHGVLGTPIYVAHQQTRDHQLEHTDT